MNGDELQGVSKRWRVAERLPEDMRSALPGQSVMLSHLLWRRGYQTPEQIAQFLSGTPISHDPFRLPDMAVAVERVLRARREGERVAVYGDFDCDGLTASAVLVHTLRAYGLDPVAYIPDRAEGHGLHPEAIAALRDQAVGLIITADCGITDMDEVLVARAMGMDVVITDHHAARIDLSLPNCPSVCPTRHDAEYPCNFLSGVGVAYKLAQALAVACPGPEPERLLDLVALGTVADVVPLRDENRSLVIRGLQQLHRSRRPGLAALARVAGVEVEELDADGISFYLAPRINAANRMASPRLAYELLMAELEEEALPLAQQLSDFNQLRRGLVEQHLSALLQQVGDPALVAAEVAAGNRPPVLLVVGDWHAGISGLLASKLSERYGLPAFVGSDGGTGTVSVSARGSTDNRIDDLLEAIEAGLPGGLFQGYGGHAAAGGFRLASERLPEAVRLLEAEAGRRIRVGEHEPVLEIDAEVRLDQLTTHTAHLVQELAPFGQKFPQPCFLTRGVTLQRVTPLRQGGRRFTLSRAGSQIRGVSFYPDEPFTRLAPGAQLDVAFNLTLNRFQGRESAEIHLCDWRPAEPAR